MDTQVLDIIINENKKQPLTDEEIGKKLNISRDKVNDIREKHQIPNSRERLEPYLIEDVRNIYKRHREISHRRLLAELNNLGYNISRHLALKVLHNVMDAEQILKNDSEPPKYDNASAKTDVPSRDPAKKYFENIVGYNSSLRLQIRQAQASILYPPKGLHTLILGPSGAGKSQLADAMHKFALSTENFTGNAPFIVFNCADYAENPQLLLSQLFGYVKGAFTGADKDKDGIIEHANGGILFLDEIHRLPSEGQEILFSILDKGVYKKLGETASERKVSLMIIAATTENPESALLATFRRRIPMVIELPPLSKRTITERYELIKLFFSAEAKKINKDIIVDKDVINMLLLYECPGNSGQLRSDIQVACARGLLNTMLEKNNCVNIKISDLANHVRIGVLNKKLRDNETQKLKVKNLYFGVNDTVQGQEPDNRYVMPNRIYQFIEERSIKLEQEGLNPDEINLVIGREIETEFENLAKSIDLKTTITKIELKNLVGVKITRVIEDCFSIGKNYFPDLEETFYYTLAIHISATYERIIRGKSIINPHLAKIKEDYAHEYKIAAILVEVINTELEIKLPEGEIGFIAMYLRAFSGRIVKNMTRVGVVILTHGKVGKAIAEVANKLLNTNHAMGIEMSLADSPQKALEKTIEEIKKIDEGKGCLLLVDMGSLVVFGDIITKETGIPVRVVDRVDTVMALEAIRRATIPESTLDDVAAGISKNYLNNEMTFLDNENKGNLPKVIVTICITGEGSAETIKKYIENVICKMNKDIEVIPIGLISPVNVDLEIKRITGKFNILCFVGTINPEYRGIPFISVEDILNRNGIEQLNRIIGELPEEENDIREILDEELILFNMEYKDKNDALDQLVKMLQEKGYVDQGFLLSVYKREAISPTFFKGNVAIPHGFPQHVIKPVVVIAKLRNSINWAENKNVQVIFMIAYKDDSKKYFKDLYKILLNMEVLNGIKNAEHREDIRKLIMSHGKKGVP